MIIFRTANTEVEAIHIAQVFDRNELCVVSMTITPKGKWLVAGQAGDGNIDKIDREIHEAELLPDNKCITEEVDDDDETTR